MQTKPLPVLPLQRWDIFCRVIDNYGDIGVCWRLARQLAHEHGLAVRLWVDELEIAKRLIPTLDSRSVRQTIARIDICHWPDVFPDAAVADVVIEAFACELPQNYVLAMAERPQQPVWLNLEYLSAETWVDNFHLQRSPHPILPLTKYFFFPGFSLRTGGLIREKNLIEQREMFQRSSSAQATFWQRLSVVNESALKISLFCYADAPIADLLEVLVQHEQAVLCLVPESVALSIIAKYFASEEQKVPLEIGQQYQKGNLTLQILPFLAAETYDQLLWACDLNFVRGEDSWIRALWAAKPFIWQPYRQQEETHLIKLNAFIERYGSGLNASSREVLDDFHHNWCSHTIVPSNARALLLHLPALQLHATTQTNQFAKPVDLASALTTFAATFCENKL